MHKNSTNSFTQVILQILSLIFFSLSLLMMFTPKYVSLITHIGISGEISSVILQFLGSAYFLLGCLLYIIKYLEVKYLKKVLLAINLMGFSHLYLIFKCNDSISLPYIYFAFQILMQLILIYCLIVDVNKEK